MRRYLFSLSLLALSTPLAAFASESTGPYATQTMINAGGVQFSLPRLGTFSIYAVEAEAEASECYVSLESVAEDLERSIATGDFELAPGKTWTIKLKKIAIAGRPKCYGPGKGCKVYVTTSTVDAPTIEPI